MAKTPVSDLYERYKIGTNRIVEWLAETGGLRKTNAAGLEGEGEFITVTTNDITALAQQILADSSSAKAAPDGLQNTICVLESQAQNADNKQDKKQNRPKAGHQHFIDVLRGALTCLKEVLAKFAVPESGHRRRRGAKNTARARGNPPNNDVFRNIYQGLQLDESSDIDGIQVTLATTNLQSDGRAFKPTFKLESLEEDKEFAMWCLLRDCHEIRDFIRSLWESYANGQVTIMTAADVTEKAFVLIGRAAEIFAADFPSLATFDQIADHIGWKSVVEDPRDEESVHQNPLLCIPAYIEMSRSRELHGLSEKEVGSKQHLDLLEEVRSSQLGARLVDMVIERENRGNDWVQLLAVFCDTFIGQQFEAHCDGIPLKIATVINYQIYMDIIAITARNKYSVPCALIDAHGLINRRLNDFGSKAEDAIKDHIFRKKFLTCAKRQQILQNLTNVPRSLILEAGVGYARFSESTITNFPVFAGRISVHNFVASSIDGLEACDEEGISTCVATLYRACRTSGLLRKSWKDMEQLIGRADPKSIGFRDLNSSEKPLRQIAKNFGLAMGVSAREYSKESIARRGGADARVPLPTPKQVEGRRQHLQALSPQLAHRLDFEQALKVVGLPMGQAALTTLHSTVSSILDDDENPIDADIKVRWQFTRKLSHVDLLSVWTSVLDVPGTRAGFDFHGLFLKFCWYMDQIRQNRADFPKDWTLIQVVDEVLWEAAAVESNGGGLRALGATALGFVARLFAQEEKPSEFYDGAELAHAGQLCQKYKMKERAT
ncbi:uncharacterized protein MYCFIDRAFT_85533 [Pseudocercospora fijiensis CIRAD86]|uniref:DUF6604 domain-containing protein n=1 Tax=Pseudocercospora fijiensis (strain CIRAD86) TaxID=383855 RepID=M3A4L2_PSEFD|nr:uncharacterized protein MYCFIDRAFT_85533 [Pseudocercospora fijiensis CIRAD86]EME79546.1 hypothetical protein MYCFIDRAFT_85533 [Pseudocercospora fijiensis CIRAD86]